MNRSWSVPIVAFAFAAGAAGCGGRVTESAAARSADQHAQNASIVLSRIHDHAVPAAWAATWVTGGTTGNAIAALVAEGTTFRGTIVLRITDATRTNDFDADETTRCYRYTLDRYTDAAKQLPNCPDLPALDLADPPTPDALTPASATRVAGVLTRLSPRSSASIRKAVAALFDPAVWLVVGPGSATGSTYLIVHSDTSCLISTVPATGPVTVTGPLQREACTGG